MGENFCKSLLHVSFLYTPHYIYITSASLTPSPSDIQMPRVSATGQLRFLGHVNYIYLCMELYLLFN